MTAAASAAERRVRAALGVLLLTSGLVWSAMFPKRASFDPDMVISVCIAVGLAGSGTFLLCAAKLARGVVIVCLALLASVLWNVCQLAETRALAALLRDLAPSATSR